MQRKKKQIRALVDVKIPCGSERAPYVAAFYNSANGSNNKPFFKNINITLLFENGPGAEYTERRVCLKVRISDECFTDWL
jgi:hypothetical protein